MAMSCLSIVAIFAFLCQQSAGSSAANSDFRYRLFSHYDKYLAPSGPEDGPVAINHSLSIYRVLALENDVLTLSVWEYMGWIDPRLQWDAKSTNISSMQILSDQIWQPDILLLDSVEEYTGFPSKEVFAFISANGGVTYVPPRIRKATCMFSESDLFEDNIVTCSLKYMSWTSSLSSMDLRNTRPSEILMNDNQHWRVEDITSERNTKMYDCCPDTYVDITYKIMLKRIK